MDHDVWNEDGIAPDGTVIYAGHITVLASSRCPADMAITRLWQQRWQAWLVGVKPGDDGWPVPERRSRAGRPRKA